MKGRPVLGVKSEISLFGHRRGFGRGGGCVGRSFLRHLVFLFEGVAEFIYSLVYGSSRFTDVHEEVFVYWPGAL